MPTSAWVQVRPTQIESESPDYTAPLIDEA